MNWQSHGLASPTRIVGQAVLTSVALCGLVGATASAQLSAAGPVNPANGYPRYYTDSNGLSLQPCLDANICSFVPALDLPNPNAPITFPGNFPEELFYSRAIADVTTGGGGRAICVLALEGAFANGPVVNGDQVVFARVRFRVDNVVAGRSYRITHPYGVDNIVAAASGLRGINVTDDVGILAPLNFNAALAGRVNPFLRWNPAESAPPAGYVGDFAIPHTILGSPNNTNFFRVEGTDIGGPGIHSIQTNLWIVQGKILNAPPIANAGADQSGTIGVPITFNGSGSSDPENQPLTFSWNFGDGTPAGSGPMPTHAFATAGPFTVTLTVSDGVSSATDTALVTITGPNLAPTANAGPDQTGVVGTSVQFDGSASMDPNLDPLTFMWDFGDGSPAAAGVRVGHVFTSAGPFTVTLTASDGLLMGTDTALVTIAPMPRHPMFLMSFKASTALPGVGLVANEDIVALDRVTGAYSVFFDGSDVGLANAAINAFCLLPTGEILMSLTANFNVPGLTGGPSGLAVAPADIVKFTPTSLGATTAGSFSFRFDGSDVGLTTTTENVDAIGLNAAGNLVLSLSGLGSVSGLSGVQGADLIKFTATRLGAVTAGTFSMFFDGSDVSLTLSTENIDAVFVGPLGAIYLGTSGGFSVPGVIGTNEDIVQFIPTSLGTTTAGTHHAFFDGSANFIPTSAALSGFAIMQ